MEEQAKSTDERVRLVLETVLSEMWLNERAKGGMEEEAMSIDPRVSDGREGDGLGRVARGVGEGSQGD